MFIELLLVMEFEEFDLNQFLNWISSIKTVAESFFLEALLSVLYSLVGKACDNET